MNSFHSINKIEEIFYLFSLTSTLLLNGAPVTIADQVHAGFRIVDENPVNAPARSTITNTRVTLYGNIYKNPTDSLFNPAYTLFDPKNPVHDPLSNQYNPAAILPVYVPYDVNSPYNDPLSENWAVSAPISLDSANLGRDWSTTVRSAVYTAKPTTYKYTYAKPGTYKAVFVASNNTIDESKQVIKEITIIVE